MEPKFTVAGSISKPVEEVFKAVVEPGQLTQYFATGGASGRLEAGVEVAWNFHESTGACPVLVQEVVPNRKIVLQWEPEKDSATWTTVTMEFQPLDDGRTLVRITEFGWPATPDGLSSSFVNCEGWTGMICAMKAWLEHGINLREGFYK